MKRAMNKRIAPVLSRMLMGYEWLLQVLGIVGCCGGLTLSGYFQIAQHGFPLPALFPAGKRTMGGYFR